MRVLTRAHSAAAGTPQGAFRPRNFSGPAAGAGDDGAMGYSRSDRVADLIKEEIASMILHGGIKDPRIGFVTITHVKLSPDFRDAKVYFSQIGTDKEKEKSRSGLNSAGGYIRRALAKRLNLRHIPSVTFFFDDSLEYSDHIEQVIKEMNEKDGQ